MIWKLGYPVITLVSYLFRNYSYSPCRDKMLKAKVTNWKSKRIYIMHLLIYFHPLWLHEYLLRIASKDTKTEDMLLSFNQISIRKFSNASYAWISSFRNTTMMAL